MRYLRYALLGLLALAAMLALPARAHPCPYRTEPQRRLPCGAEV